ncbi:conjugal transfer protein TraF [Geomesophilobacter sediminis]|uniref:Conjugal transfer protein TraF n=1 Tax=Geomesophilobacter sediminis TaxID=2798584 RepID=A0A8J7J4A4_9BACT|nr:conjugal transfer protein TraF [Geomesophilobacter sediminis]MBJ6725638.1 conjugal transfer protein TraF [Geomesophilobacter sediminis]
MKKPHQVLAITAALLSFAGAAHAAEWQPIGTLGIGGAGVARQNGAFTAYWNPAGGAFNDKTFSFMTGAEFGVRGNDALTDNVDKLSKIKFDQIKDLGNNATPDTVANAVKLIGILDDISKRGGNLSISGGVPVGFAIKHLSFGVFGNFEGSVVPVADTTNILPNQTSGNTVTPTDIYNALSHTPGFGSLTNNGFFTDAQRSILIANLTTPTVTAPQATQAVDALQITLAAQGQSADVAFDAASKLTQSIASGSNSSISNNTSSVVSKALLYAEAPIAYGHPINLGQFGTLGVGVAVKAIAGSVYQNQVLLVNDPSGKAISSGDLGKQLTKNHEQSNNIGVDAGVLWKKSILSVGVVGKNLNKPTFKAPNYQKYTNDPTTGAIVTTTVKGEDVALDPMVRAGIALDPWKWLTIAADMDLTKNKSVGPLNNGVKSQNIGGGVEIHPWSILKVRAGAMKNIAAVDGSTNPLILTAGLSFLFLDLDAAAATKTFKVDNKTIPEELRVQLMAGFSF